ncbi:acyltransferase [Paraburkholderia panacisoli]|uniref:Acyltransferase n=1 Tax=Paraburkholderia panacisoli TaxID=2603818 RepID=A0A5B0HCQ0_9BURK|nr:acyltransferase [Paraburkholderia panacisoli]KAA1013045.1 acyltransferase [Paraburkholderia panacisoli]
MKQEKLDFVSALRGLAACYVALFHLPHLAGLLIPSWFQPFSDAGMSAVSLFFVISAFTLCMSTASRAEENAPIRNFLMRRFFRIAPLFYIWIVLGCVRDYLVYGTIHSEKDVLLNATFLFNFSPSTVEGIPWAAWTLGVEMVFYVLFPWIFRALSDFGRAFLALAVTGLVGIWWESAMHAVPGPFWMFGFLSRLPIFILGICVYHLYVSARRWSQEAKRYAGCIALGSGVFWYMAIAYRSPSEPLLPLDYQQALSWASIAFGLSQVGGRFVANRVTNFMGDISYSFYLTHATVFNLMAAVFAWVIVHSGMHQYGLFVCYAIGTFVVAGLSYAQYRLVEQRGIRFGSRLIRRLESRAPIERAAPE